jgi:hypothetical protein
MSAFSTSPTLPAEGTPETDFERPVDVKTAARFLGVSASLDHRSLNIDTFDSIYVLMGHALPEEA